MIPKTVSLWRVMAEVMEERERDEGRRQSYRQHIEIHLRAAEAAIRAARSRIERTEEHYRIEMKIDEACGRLGAVEAGYDCLLRDLEG